MLSSRGDLERIGVDGMNDAAGRQQRTLTSAIIGATRLAMDASAAAP
jgi:hypothetical protein